jgi:hypothetical protein
MLTLKEDNGEATAAGEDAEAAAAGAAAITGPTKNTD